jgi:FMN-dependent oxidoreductase (nitrilotriacetate monooxygenase family)
MHLNIFAQCSPSPQFKGLWRHPADQTATGYRSLDYWIRLAQRLESACIDALFLADVHGVYDVYGGSWAPAVRHAVQIPTIDPTLLISALAAATRHLGFAVTYSTTYHPPYECARLFSSLDHITGGRIGWNVVTSYLRSATENGLGEHLAHDDRYDRADEYLAVVRALWERSWEEHAVLRDVDANVFTDPAKVHDINHQGRWFQVRGPHQCEPSVQRTPVLYQAGASDRGTTFAARHAEVVFLTLGDPQRGTADVADLRRRAADFGRDPHAIKALQGSLTLLGRTKEEVKAKADLVAELTSAEGMLAKWSGWMGFDLAAYPDDTPVDDIRTDAIRSVVDRLKRADPTRAWTIADIRFFVTSSARPHHRNWLIGTPSSVADRMEEWMSTANVDGFNLVPCPPTSGIDDICDLLVPELQRRGLFRNAYDATQTTLRERYFGTGRARCEG